MNSPRVLVTGSAGLVGRAVMSRLRALGLMPPESPDRAGGSAEVLRADLTDAMKAATIVNQVAPTAIVHLAGTATGDQASSTARTWRATRNLLEAVAQLAPESAVIVFGSAAEYGDPLTARVAEDHPTLRSPTTVDRSSSSRCSPLTRCHTACASASCGLSISSRASSRPPPRSAICVGNCFAQRADETVRCGRLDIVRDFVPLDFVVETLVRLLQLDEWPSRLNICSGTGIELADVLTAMATHFGAEINAKPIPELAAITAPKRIVGDPSLLRSYGLSCEPTPDALARVMIVAAGHNRLFSGSLSDKLTEAQIYVGNVGETADIVGSVQLELLLENGLEPSDHVLDIGCGALVAGKPLLEFLEPGHYVGIEPNVWLLDAVLTSDSAVRHLCNVKSRSSS